jgi:hypothetical protein
MPDGHEISEVAVLSFFRSDARFHVFLHRFSLFAVALL